MKQTISLLSILALLIVSGCGTLAPGPYNSNKVLYSADLTIATSYSAIDGFLTWEVAHRGKPECPPNATAAADDLRSKAPKAFKAAVAARDVYSSASTSSNESALQTALTALQSLVSIANTYLIPTIK